MFLSKKVILEQIDELRNKLNVNDDKLTIAVNKITLLQNWLTSSNQRLTLFDKASRVDYL